MKLLLKSLEKLKLTSKLIIGFSTGIVIAVILGIVAFQNLQSLTEDMQTLYDKDTLGIYHIGEANKNLIYIGRALRSMLIAQDEEKRDAYQSLMQIRRSDLNASLLDVRKKLFREAIILQYDLVQADLVLVYQYFDRAEKLILRSEEGKVEAARYITSQDFVDVIKKADEDLQHLSELKLKAAEESIRQAVADSKRAELWMIVLVGFGILMVSLTGMLISSVIKRPNDRLRLAVQDLAEGHVDAPIPHLDYKNEIGKMAMSIEYLREIYRKSNEQHWIKSQISEVIEATRATDDFRSMSQAVVSKLSPMVGAGHGAFYVADSGAVYHLMASYGFRERKHLSNSYGLGEGLVGQCVVEKSTIMLTAPKDYIRISSGLGEGPPASIVVVPIIHSDRVLGVLEFGSFQQFKERELTLLEELLPILASNMEILDRNVKTRELLVATKEQAERMEMQAAQLEEQTVEMEAQQAELMETENWFKSIIETAPDGMLVVDAGGQIVLSNPALSRIFGYTAMELAKGGLLELFSIDKGIHQAVKAEAHHQGERRWSTLQGQHKDGALVEVSVILNALPERGTRGICTSITVRELES